MNKDLAMKILKFILKLLDYIFEELVEIGAPEEPKKEEPENFLFPMEYLRVTQGENTGSHVGGKAMDFGGRDQGKDALYCPCEMKVIRIRPNRNGEVYLESTKPVKFADGTVNYARLLLIHDDTLQNYKEGDILKQGDYFYLEGGMSGGVRGKLANHVHIEGGKGKWVKAIHYLVPGTQDKYSIENPESLNKLFIVPKDTIILEDGGYKWVTL